MFQSAAPGMWPSRYAVGATSISISRTESSWRRSAIQPGSTSDCLTAVVSFMKRPSQTPVSSRLAKAWRGSVGGSRADQPPVRRLQRLRRGEAEFVPEPAPKRLIGDQRLGDVAPSFESAHEQGRAALA